jgi:hypothetical protein
LKFRIISVIEGFRLLVVSYARCLPPIFGVVFTFHDIILMSFPGVFLAFFAFFIPNLADLGLASADVPEELD